MFRLLLTLQMALAAPATWALSCMQTDVATAYLQAEASEESYVILRGTFDFEAGALAPVAVLNNNPPMRQAQARFVGGAFTRRDFAFQMEVSVRIDALCAGPWCAAMTPGEDVLAFVERTETGEHVLTIGPCGGRVFTDPTREQIDQVKSCHAGRRCVPASER